MSYNKSELSKMRIILAELWKSKLSFMVAFTSVGSYVICGGPLCSLKTVGLGLGTFFLSASACTLNQIIERDLDKIMPRTRNRPLPSKEVSVKTAAWSSAITGVLGLGALLYAHPLSCGLGVVNWIMYTAVYTPMKTRHYINTWLGLVNGALPPLMGSVAALGTLSLSPVTWYLPAVLGLWQIPHFMALSYGFREEYHEAGFQMLSISNPPQAAYSSVIFSSFLLPACGIYAYFERNTINPFFHPITLLGNGAFIWYSLKWQRNLTKRNANSLFFCSLFHIAGVTMTSMILKPPCIFSPASE